MIHRFQATLTLLVLAASLVACAPLPVAAPPVVCPDATQLLGFNCAAPRPLVDGITYADLIAIGIDDRNALRACAKHSEALVMMARKCQGALKDYNEQLDKINQGTSTKP